MHAEQQRNREAESAWTRKQLWGDDSTTRDDDMRQTILGDVTHPTPVVVTGGNNGGGLGQMVLPLLVGAALTGIPAAGIAGAGLAYFLSQPNEQQPAPSETMQVGLGRIEDLLKDE